MGSSFIIAGLSFRRRSIIRLSLDERATLARSGTIVVNRSVEWPLVGRVPTMNRALVDPGGTDIWGPGPYLKVPNIGVEDAEELVNRVFCPWGYPPSPLRAFRRNIHMRLAEVALTRASEAEWEWRLTLVAG